MLLHSPLRLRALPCLLGIAAASICCGVPAAPPLGDCAESGERQREQAAGEGNAETFQVRGDAKVAVSTNFWVHSQHPLHRADAVAAECERQRLRLQRRWLGGTRSDWQRPCEIVIYADEFAYLRHAGPQAAMTRGVCQIDRQQQQIVSRRLRLMADPQSQQLTALSHELTHVVLADRFPACPPPRWADEGIALLADGAAKRSLHLRDVRQALASKCCPSVNETFAMQQYPTGERRTAFYGQSLSLVDYLAHLDEPVKVVEMIALAMDRGYPLALQEVYGIASVVELERRWQSSLDGPTP